MKALDRLPLLRRSAMDLRTILLIAMALFGFFLLAAILLVPAYLFLRREKKVSEQWTPEALARRARETPPSPNGSHAPNTADEEQPGA